MNAPPCPLNTHLVRLVGKNLGFGEGGKESQGTPLTCMKHCPLKWNLVVEILGGGGGNILEGNPRSLKKK